MNRMSTGLGAGLCAALFLTGPAAAQTFSPADFDRGAAAPEAIFQELGAKAAAMPGVAGKAPPSASAEAVVPVLPGATKKEFLKPFHDAFLNAIARLHAPKCAAFYGEGAEAKFEGVIYGFARLGGPHVNDEGNVTVVGAATYSQMSPVRVFINADGPFANQSMYVMGKSGFQTVDMGTNLRGADFAALLLLHELGHVVGKFGPDANDGKLNRSYTDAVLKNCFR
jgi:hypothetical protein